MLILNIKMREMLGINFSQPIILILLRKHYLAHCRVKL